MAKHLLPRLENIDINITRQLVKSSLETFELNTPMMTPEDIDKRIKYITDVITKSIKRSKIQAETIKKKSPWWSRELCALRHQLRKAQKISNTSTSHLEQFKKLKTTYQKEIRGAKFKAWKTFCTEELEADPFKAIRKGTRKPSKPILSMKVDGVITTEEPSILKCLSDTFFPGVPEDPESLKIIEEMNKELDSLSNDTPPPITQKVLYVTILSMKKNKAPGNDGITSEHLGCLHEETKGVILDIFNACLRLSYFPSKWKSAQVPIIPKPGRADYQVASAYRPISLLPVLGKCPEKLF